MELGATCVCELGNTGKPGIICIQSVTVKHFFVARYDSEGNENKYDMNDPANFTAAFINERINDPDPFKRWFPTPGLLKNVEDTREDSIKQDFNDGSTSKLRDGKRSFNGFVPGLTAQIFKQFEEYGCVEIGVLEISRDGDLTGSRRDGIPQPGATEDYLYPILVETGSWDARYVKPSDQAAPGIMLMFNFSEEENDGDLWTIQSNQIPGINLKSVNGLWDVTGALVGAVTTTTFTVDLKAVIGNSPVRGLVTADFYDSTGGTASRVYNVTDSASVTLTSATESLTVPGRYTFVMSVAQTSADVIRITPVKEKYDFTMVSNLAITIP